jgi:ectoine hydroxylase-related dioxygenase (phytanoyl-CoA dioxygenase family)
LPTLSEAQVRQYHTEGFTVAPDFVRHEVVDELLDELEDVTRGNTLADYNESRMEMEPDQPPDGTLVRRLYDPCTHYPGFVALSENAKILDCVEQLIGPDILFESSKVNLKPPQIGSVVEWHQDGAYGLLTNMDSLAVIMYMDEATRNNGCAQLIPTHPKEGLLDHSSNGYFVGKVTEEMDTSEALPIEGGAGALIFLHTMTPHSSLANRSDRPRRTVIWGYRAAHAYPIYMGQNGPNEVERLVRGRRLDYARFEEMERNVPRYPEGSSSLYQLQERARKS